MDNLIEPLAAARTVSVRGAKVQIVDLTIDRPGIVGYLNNIAVGKREIAILHALEVGIGTIQARRADAARRAGDRP